MNWPFGPKAIGAVILLYHRVADVKDDPLLLSVSPANFRRQLEAMKKILRPISLQDIAKSLRESKTPSGFAVTFDDGYADNLLEAAPILERLKIPASIYVIAGKVDQAGPFDWDKKTAKTDQGRAMSKDELRQLSSSKYIEIGGHTISHPHLGLIKASEQRAEINGSKERLEEYIGIPVTGFAYPYGAYEGDFTKTTKKIAEEVGFNYACANIPAIVTAESDPYALPRVLVRNWQPDEMLENIKAYLPNEYPTG